MSARAAGNASRLPRPDEPGHATVPDPIGDGGLNGYRRAFFSHRKDGISDLAGEVTFRADYLPKSEIYRGVIGSWAPFNARTIWLRPSALPSVEPVSSAQRCGTAHWARHSRDSHRDARRSRRTGHRRSAANRAGRTPHANRGRRGSGCRAVGQAGPARDRNERRDHHSSSMGSVAPRNRLSPAPMPSRGCRRRRRRCAERPS